MPPFGALPPIQAFPTFADPNYVNSFPPNPYYFPPISYGSLGGADLLLDSVISFEVRILIDEPSGFAKTGKRLRADGVTAAYVDPFVDLFDSQVYLKENATPIANPVVALSALNSPNPRFTSTANPVPNLDGGGTLPGGPAVFDTWSSLADPNYDYSNWRPSSTPGANNSKTLPLNMRILAVQITLRVWDKNTQQTRQMTFVQSM